MFVGALLVLATTPSCGDSNDDGNSDGAEDGTDFGPGSGGDGNGNGGSGASSGDGDDLSGNGDDGSGLGRAGFRFGINLGNPNPEFDDSEMSDLARDVGVRSIRIKYPEYHFFNWGQDIEVGDAEHYASLGMKDHVAFVIGMSQDHSTAPDGTDDWERDYYIPKNLYEPIFLENGSINPANYYAVYLSETFETYSPWVKYWEIFNEPDWVADWQVTQTWDTEPPTAEQLVRFHGSIFDYVRMLRIATEVRNLVAPGTYILTGGLGYPSFLSALLRYTDNPDGGKVSDRYPKTGADYFDVLSIHHYPHLVDDGSSDSALDSLTRSRDAFLGELDKAKVSKGWMVTENGAAHTVIDGAASGPEYARNYLQKSMIWAKAEGFLGIDWFPLSDGKNASDAFSRMGLYEDLSALSSIDAAQPTTSGDAYLTVSTLLGDARLDIDKTEALALPDGARGFVFRAGDKSVYALWAITDEDEDVSVSALLPTTAPLHVFTWDAGDAESSQELTPSEGRVSVQLTGSPIFLSE